MCVRGDTGLDKVILGLPLGYHHISAVHDQLDHEQLDWFPNRQLGVENRRHHPLTTGWLGPTEPSVHFR